MGNGNFLKRRSGRTVSTLMALGIGFGLVGCDSDPVEAGHSASAPETTESVTVTTSGPASRDPQHPYTALPGRITNTEGPDGHLNGTRVYSGPRALPEDQVEVASILPQDAPVQVLCRVAVGRTVDFSALSSPGVVDELGRKRTDWDLLQGPLLGESPGGPGVKAGDIDAGGWVPSGFVDVGMSPDEIPVCRHLPS